MDKVLVDGSTVVFVSRLLAGSDRPSAINLFDLAVLTESLILHDEVIVLATTGPAIESVIDAAAAQFGSPVRVEHRSTSDLLWEYVQRNGYGADGLAPSPARPREPGEDLRATLASAHWLWKTLVSQGQGDTSK